MDSIVIEHIYQSPIKTIWRALTDDKQMWQWYFPEVTFRPEVGFETQFNIHHEVKDFLHLWKVVEVVPFKKNSYEWRYGGFPGNSLWTFELFDEQGTNRLLLTHKWLESFIPEQNHELSSANFVKVWSHFMGKALPEFLETQRSLCVDPYLSFT